MFCCTRFAFEIFPFYFLRMIRWLRKKKNTVAQVEVWYPLYNTFYFTFFFTIFVVRILGALTCLVFFYLWCESAVFLMEIEYYPGDENNVSEGVAEVEE
jgi:hypothetical protein